jgi:hypothetical protein
MDLAMNVADRLRALAADRMRSRLGPSLLARVPRVPAGWLASVAVKFKNAPLTPPTSTTRSTVGLVGDRDHQHHQRRAKDGSSMSNEAELLAQTLMVHPAAHRDDAAEAFAAALVDMWFEQERTRKEQVV